MKKTISLALAVLLLIALLTGCGKTKTEDVTVRLGGLKGATSIGMVKLLEDAEKGETENEYAFTMAGSADELTPQLLKGELDIIAAPVNLGAVLYNKSNGGVQMAAINTLGILYVVEKGGETVQSMTDLKGRTVYASGKGSTPEYTLRYLLAQNGLDMDKDLVVEWKSEPSEIVAAMSTEDSAVAMLPQPYATVAATKLEGLRTALDLTEEWSKVGGDSQLLTAGIFVRAAFAKEHPEMLKTFLQEYAASTTYVNENVEEAASLVEKYDIVKAGIAKQAIPQCNIVCITGNEMKTAAEGYFDVLYSQNKDSLGGSLPGDDFYILNQ